MSYLKSPCPRARQIIRWVALSALGVAANPATLVARLLDQPEGLPKIEQVVFADQNVPSLDFVQSLPTANYPVYGIYTWMGEFNRLKDDIKEVGYKTLRVGGDYSDENMKALFDSGLNFSLMAQGGGGKRDAYETNEEYLEARVEGLREFLTRFGENGTFYQDFPEYEGRYIPFMQIHNEPNFHYMWKAGTEAQREELYSKLSPALIEVIREMSPKTKIVGFSAGGAGAGDMRFVRSVLEKSPEIIEELDVFATHPYQHPAPPELNKKEKWGSYSIANSLFVLRRNFAEYGRADIPVWYTEGGWTISKEDGGAYDVSKETVPLMHHAAYTCRYYSWAARLGVQCVTAMFITDTDGHAGGHFNRLKNFEWRPTAHAVQNMIRLMPHPKLHAIQSDGEDGNYIHEFRSNALEPESPVVIMAYRIQDPEMVEIEVPYNRATVTDMLGNSVDLTARGGSLSVEIGPYPVYIQEAL